MRPDAEAAAIVRECFDGTEESVTRTVRRIGEVLRASVAPTKDLRQVEMFAEAQDGRA